VRPLIKIDVRVEQAFFLNLTNYIATLMAIIDDQPFWGSFVENPK